MSRSAKLSVAAFLLILGLAIVLRDDLATLGEHIATRNMWVTDDRDNFDPGPAMGSQFPGLRARHEADEVRLLQGFAGVQGTLLVIEASPEHSPYGRRFLEALERESAGFQRAGINIVVLLPAGSDAGELPFPVLTDEPGKLSVKTLGLSGAEGGSTHPGTILVAKDGSVADKIFLRDGEERVYPQAVLERSKTALNSR